MVPRPSRYSTLLILLILLHLVHNAAVIALDHHFDIPDAADYYDWGLQIAAKLKRAEPLQALRVLWSNQERPPLGIVPTALFMAVWPSPDPVVARCSVLPWLALLMWAVYRVGIRLHSPAAGLVAAACTAAFPAVFGFSRLLWLDVPLGAMTALAMLAMLRTDHFRRLRPTLLFGVVTGLGLLTKHAFPIFLLPTALGYLVVGLRQSTGPRRRPLLHVTLAALVAAALFALWLVPHFQFYIWIFYLSQTDTPQHGPQALTAIPLAARVLHNLWLIPTALMGPVLLLLYLGSVVWLVRRDARRVVGITTLWLWGSLLLLSLFVSWPRYPIPALPGAALAIGVGVTLLPGFDRRRWHLPLALGLLCLLPIQSTWFGPKLVWCENNHPTERVFCAGMIRPERHRSQRPSFAALPRKHDVMVTVLPRWLHRTRPPEYVPAPFDHIPEAVRYWMLEDGLTLVECNWEIRELVGSGLDRNQYVVVVEGAGLLQPSVEDRMMLDDLVRRLQARPRWWREIMTYRFERGPRLRLFGHRLALDLP